MRLAFEITRFPTKVYLGRLSLREMD